MPIINGVQSIPKHPLENYTLLKHLGSGGQGTVTLAQHRQSGAHVAIKTISKTPRCSRAFLEDEDAEYDSSTDITSFSKPINGTIDEPRFILGRVINEYFTHCRVKSEGQLAKMIGIAHDSLNYYLILEFYPGGDLETLVQKHSSLSKQRVQILMAHLVVALKTLRKRGIVHCDIKPENILTDVDGHFVLSDFGTALCFAKNFCDEERNSGLLSAETLKEFEEKLIEKGDNFAGTPDFMAPEVWVDGETFSYSADVWSAGVVGFYALVGRLPWDPAASSADTSQMKVSDGEMVEDLDTRFDIRLKDAALEYPELVEAGYQVLTAPIEFTDEERNQFEIDEITEDFLFSMLDRDPYTRATVEELQAHPFFDKFDWKCLEVPSSGRSACRPSEMMTFATEISNEDEEPFIEMGSPYGADHPDPTPFLNRLISVGLAFAPTATLNLDSPSLSRSLSNTSLAYSDSSVMGSSHNSSMPASSSATTLIDSPIPPPQTPLPLSITYQQPVFINEASTDGGHIFDRTNLVYEPKQSDSTPFFGALSPSLNSPSAPVPAAGTLPTTPTTEHLVSSLDFSPTPFCPDPVIPPAISSSLDVHSEFLDLVDLASPVIISLIGPSPQSPSTLPSPSESYVLLSLDSLIIVDEEDGNSADTINMEYTSDTSSSESTDTEVHLDTSFPDSAKVEIPRPLCVFSTMRTWATKVWHGIKSWVGWA